MRTILTMIAALLLAAPVMAQRKGKGCKPSFSQTDKFTNTKIETWGYWIEGTSFGEMMWKSDHLNVFFGGQTEGDTNYFVIKMSVWDKSAQSAQYGGKIEGAKGNSFFLAFADGESLEFTSTNCINKSNYDASTKLYDNSVFYSVKIADEDIPKLKERFSSHLLTAARFQLLNGINRDQNFVEKHSIEMQRIMNCYFDTISGE